MAYIFVLFLWAVLVIYHFRAYPGLLKNYKIFFNLGKLGESF